MAAPVSTDEFLDLVRKSGVADERRLADYLQKARSNGGMGADASRMAGYLVRDGILTQFQAEQILQGKWRRFTIGKYKVLEKLGSGGMGAVYLCEHKLMRRRVAVKVLPTAKASDDSSLQRFYREARAVAALDHPNIVHAYDIDQDEQLHFLVMEYVDGASFQELVKASGPLDIGRACHYIRQAARGLDHASSKAGIVHRDIKPGNILVDRVGVVKILDMGLARFFNDEDDNVTKNFDETVLGTADYLAPEQAVDSHSVDIRADIYSLGATFYFLLCGRTPFGDGTVAQKLIWHQSRQPKPVTEFRKDVPPDLSALLLKMMAKLPDDRFQTPMELADALEPFTREPIGPPTDAEMPRLSPAATGVSVPNDPGETSVGLKGEMPAAAPRALQGMSSPPPRSMGSAGTAGTQDFGPTTPVSPMPKSRPSQGAPPQSPAPRKLMTPRPTPRSTIEEPGAQFTPIELPPAPKLSSTPEPTPAGGPSFWDLGDDSSVVSKPASSKSRPASSKRISGGLTGRGEKKSLDPKLVRLAMVIGGGVIGLAVLVTVLLFAFRSSGPTGPVTPGKPGILEVTADRTKKGSQVFHTIKHAIDRCQKGDTISLLDEVVLENLNIDFLDQRKPSEITIQSGAGKPVHWTTANKNNLDLPLLRVSNAVGFKVKDIVFDGDIAGRSLNRLVEINGKSSNLSFDNAHFEKFTECAIRMMGVHGKENEEARFKAAQFDGDSDTASGVDFYLAGTQQNDYLDFSDAKFSNVKGGDFRLRNKDAIGPHVIGIPFNLTSKQPKKK
jgi:eukaryotic-like serine/threonine-protein kinase